jgi:hypothetical protein
MQYYGGSKDQILGQVRLASSPSAPRPAACVVYRNESRDASHECNVEATGWTEPSCKQFYPWSLAVRLPGGLRGPGAVVIAYDKNWTILDAWSGESTHCDPAP